MGFHRLVMEEGGAMRYTVKLGETPVGGPVELRVSGAHLEYEPVLVFTEENFDMPQVVSIVVQENFDITGDYWMDLVHTFSSGTGGDGSWWTTRDPLIGDAGRWWTTRDPMDQSIVNPSWNNAKLWCLENGAALPLTLPLLVVDNDFAYPDTVVWELDTLVAGTADEWGQLGDG